MFNLWMLFVTFGLWYNFIKAHITNPGYLPTSAKARSKTIIELAESGNLNSSTFCSSCVVGGEGVGGGG